MTLSRKNDSGAPADFLQVKLDRQAVLRRAVFDAALFMEPDELVAYVRFVLAELERGGRVGQSDDD